MASPETVHRHLRSTSQTTGRGRVGSSPVSDNSLLPCWTLVLRHEWLGADDGHVVVARLARASTIQEEVRLSVSPDGGVPMIVSRKVLCNGRRRTGRSFTCSVATL